MTSHSEWRWATANAAARAFDRASIGWAVCNGVDAKRQLIGRDIDTWIAARDVHRAVDVTASVLRQAGWPSVWHRHINMVHQVIGCALTDSGPVTIAFDLMGDRDWWSTAGVALISDPMILDRVREASFWFSPGRSEVKTMIMPFLRGDHVKYLEPGKRRLRSSHFERLIEYGWVDREPLNAWLDRHAQCLDDGNNAPVELRAKALRDAAQDLRTLLRRASIRRPPIWLRSYSRKLFLYSLSALQFPPVSLSVAEVSPDLRSTLRDMSSGTFIDCLDPHSKLRRTYPKKPASGIAFHVSADARAKPGVSLARDAWGRWWTWRLGRRVLSDDAIPTPRSIFEAVRIVYDELATAKSPD